MPSTVSNAVFSEPSGRPTAIVQFAGSVVFASLYLYAWSVGNAGPSRWLLGMVAGSALAGVAESLPKERRWVAGVLRLSAISILLCLLVATLVSPAIVTG